MTILCWEGEGNALALLPSLLQGTGELFILFLFDWDRFWYGHWLSAAKGK
jgi:hypothetical protein